MSSSYQGPPSSTVERAETWDATLLVVTQHWWLQLLDCPTLLLQLQLELQCNQETSKQLRGALHLHFPSTQNTLSLRLKARRS